MRVWGDGCPMCVATLLVGVGKREREREREREEREREERERGSERGGTEGRAREKNDTCARVRCVLMLCA
jgi:ribosomal protein L19E